MNYSNLKTFLVKAAGSENSLLKKKAENLLEQVLNEQEMEQVVAPDIQGQGADAAVKSQSKDQVDQLLTPVFKDLAQPEGIESDFGKISSAFVTDIKIKELPKDTQKDILRFLPNANNSSVVQYGMVVDELLPKVDDHNYKQALEHVNKDLAIQGKKALGNRFQDKIKTKYILTLNDKIIDGHHFLALADVLKITCSLRVLDLTPIRFQEKRSSFISRFNGKNNYSRKGGTKVSRYSRISSVLTR